MSDIQLVPEIVIPGKRLGRHRQVDARNAGYPAPQAGEIITIQHPSYGLPLDQGDVGACTAFALCGALNTVPHWHAGYGTLGAKDAFELYSLEEQLLGDGPYPPNDDGGSGLAVCAAAKSEGLLTGYQHASGVQAALRALVVRPVITGVDCAADTCRGWL